MPRTYIKIRTYSLKNKRTNVPFLVKSATALHSRVATSPVSASRLGSPMSCCFQPSPFPPPLSISFPCAHRRTFRMSPSLLVSVSRTNPMCVANFFSFHHSSILVSHPRPPLSSSSSPLLCRHPVVSSLIIRLLSSPSAHPPCVTNERLALSIIISPSLSAYSPLRFFTLFQCSFQFSLPLFYVRELQ